MNNIFEGLNTAEIYYALEQNPKLIEHITDDHMMELNLLLMDLIAIHKAGGFELVHWDSSIEYN